jgi:HSP20 family protein
MITDRARRLQALFVPAAHGHGPACWRPAADVYRTPTGWLVKMELAGVRPEDVSVIAAGRRLTVRGSRRDWTLEEGHAHYKLEIAYSQFERSLELPCDLERMEMSLASQHGLLLISIRDKETAP